MLQDEGTQRVWRPPRTRPAAQTPNRWPLPLRAPAMAKAVTISGDATNAWVAGLPSLRAAKLRLKLVMMLLGSPWRGGGVAAWVGAQGIG